MVLSPFFLTYYGTHDPYSSLPIKLQKIRDAASRQLQQVCEERPQEHIKVVTELHHRLALGQEEKVIERIQSDVAKLVGDPVEGSIHIDETG